MTMLKTVDPIGAATAATGKPKGQAKNALPEITIAEKFKGQIAKFRLFSERKKKDEAEAATAKAEILKWAQEEYVKRLLAGEEGNFVVTDGDKGKVQFVVQSRGKVYGEAEIQTLTTTYGGEAKESLLQKDDRILLNLDVWTMHQKKLIEALNAVDASGNRLVEPEILQALFYRVMNVRDNVVQEAVKIATNKKPVMMIQENKETKEQITVAVEVSETEKLSTLLWDELKLVCAMQAK